MKRILLPASGALLATGLLAAGLAGSAQAAGDVASDPLAAKPQDAYSVAQFWLDANGEALKKAKEYQWDSKDVTKLVSGGGYQADGSAKQVNPTGQDPIKPTVVKNINLPKTIGKVFFVTSKGELSWCSASSVHSGYRNLVATAGHCVYDVAGNGDVLKNWIFVPGYYQGKAPWGVYVGKQAFTHYDFDNYEDYDRDYAFVTVYNGFSIGAKKEVSKGEYDKWVGDRWTEKVEITKDEYKKCKLNLGLCWAEGKNTANDVVGPDYPGAVLEKAEVGQAAYKIAKVGPGNGNKLGEPVTETVTKSEYDAYKANQAKDPIKYPATAWTDKYGNYLLTHYYTQSWVKPGSVKKYFAARFFVGQTVDKGRLGDNVGGQGVTWNQKLGQPVFVFGYPAGAHGDGNKPYTGVTPKWCYSKAPSKNIYTAAAYKVEEHVTIKCAMTGGADGGPWLVKYSNAKRLGYVNGVTSLFGDQDKNGRIDLASSPYFDGETGSIYNTAAKSWSGKIVGPKGEILK